jgi:erythromycin esterase-like protein
MTAIGGTPSRFAERIQLVDKDDAGRGLAGLLEEVTYPSFFLDLSQTTGLAKARLERAIGVIYRPETELASHYFQAVLPSQFDEFVWFDETTAVSPLKAAELEGLLETYPFGL